MYWSVIGCNSDDRRKKLNRERRKTPRGGFWRVERLAPCRRQLKSTTWNENNKNFWLSSPSQKRVCESGTRMLFTCMTPLPYEGRRSPFQSAHWCCDPREKYPPHAKVMNQPPVKLHYGRSVWSSVFKYTLQLLRHCGRAHTIFVSKPKVGRKGGVGYNAKFPLPTGRKCPSIQLGKKGLKRYNKIEKDSEREHLYVR